jgi:hypothetical protein
MPALKPIDLAFLDSLAGAARAPAAFRHHPPGIQAQFLVRLWPPRAPERRACVCRIQADGRSRCRIQRVDAARPIPVAPGATVVIEAPASGRFPGPEAVPQDAAT